MKKEYKCTNCRKKFKRYPSTIIKGSRTFCSKDCKYEDQKSSLLGDKNPNFTTGKWINDGKRMEKRLLRLDALIVRYISMCTSFIEMELRIKKAGLKIGRNAIARRTKVLGLPIDHFAPCRHRLIPDEKLFSLGKVCRTGTIKKRILEQNLMVYECVECGQGPEWNNKPLILELDHINGNNCDNRLENLRILCPNCHTQTPTHKGKNSKGIPKRKCH